MGEDTEVVVGDRRLKLSNLDKVLYPDAGFTKAEIIDYYARVAPAMLTHVAGRPVTFRRFPNGVDAPSFYEKNCPSHAPDWIPTVPMVGSDGTTVHCDLAEAAALVWAANLAALELHVTMGRAVDVDTPTMVVFDLDPGPPAAVLDCAEVALWVRDTLAGVGLECFPKTSGSKGLQVYLPVNTPTTFEATSWFAHTLAQALEKGHPDRVVSVMRKELRKGKVFVDWSQNSRHKTTVCAYSLRARSRPTVSTPVTWDEVERALDDGDADLLSFEAPDVVARVEELGDLFAPTATLEQELPAPPE
jgi:bifunctional non-homologous end joining protein LigD